MTLLDCLSAATDSLRTNLARSALTALGIVIGVSAVVAMVAVGYSYAGSEAEERDAILLLHHAVTKLDCEAEHWQVRVRSDAAGEEHRRERPDIRGHRHPKSLTGPSAPSCPQTGQSDPRW